MAQHKSHALGVCQFSHGVIDLGVQFSIQHDRLRRTMIDVLFLVLILMLYRRQFLPDSLQLSSIRERRIYYYLVHPGTELALQLELRQSSVGSQHSVLVNIIGIVGGVGKTCSYSQHFLLEHAHQSLERGYIACLRRPHQLFFSFP